MKQLFRILIYMACLICMAYALWYADNKVSALRERIAASEQELQDVSSRMNVSVMLKKELADLSLRMDEIYRQTPLQDRLPDVIATISALAETSGVVAQVPIVREDSMEKSEESSESFADVHIAISASGDPANLAAFLYRLEHMPYILHLASWSIDTTKQVAISAFTGVAPAAPNGQAEAPRGSSLTADLVIVTKKQ